MNFAGPIDKSKPHPGWKPIIRQYASGARKIYTNDAGKIAKSIPQTHRLSQNLCTQSLVESSIPKAEILPSIVQVSPKLRIMARMFDIPTPFLRERNILTRSSAIVMASGAIGGATEDLRSASIFSLSVPQPVTHHTVSLPDLPSSSLDELDIRGDLHKRRIEWDKLRLKLPLSAFIAMCGGQRNWNNTPPAEAREAIERKAIKAAGRNGSSLARDRRCLEKYDEYRSLKHITFPPFPVPPAIATNMAQHYMVSSDSFAEGKGTSIGPGYMAAWAHMRNHFGLDVNLEAPVADSISKHASSGEKKAEPIPLWVWDLIESQCEGPDTPARFMRRNLWIMIYTSTRAQDFHRSKSSNKYDIPRAEVILEITITKNGEEHVVVPIHAQGLRGRIGWLKQHFEQMHLFGFSTPDFDGPLESARDFNGKRMTSDKFSSIIPDIIATTGVSKAAIKQMKITGHSSHSTMDVIASVLMWSDTARNDLGRWRKSGGQNVMHHRYATRASAINQMYIRATLILAVIDIAPPPYARGFDVEHMRDSPFYDASMYVGQFVTFSIRDSDGEPVRIDYISAD